MQPWKPIHPALQALQAWEDIALPKILIIEDESDLALGLRNNLEYEGCEVITARDGEEGARLACQERPDLILLDIMLPRLSGLDVCRQLRGKGMNTPIIMLTARGQEIDKVIGLRSARTITSPSRSASANCWRAFTSGCAASQGKKRNRGLIASERSNSISPGIRLSEKESRSICRRVSSRF